MKETFVATKDDLRDAVEELFAQRDHAPQPQKELPDRIDTVKEASEIIGRSESFVYKLTMRKPTELKDSFGTPLPFSHYGSRLSFSRKKLIEWRESQTIPVIDPSDLMRNQLAVVAKRRANR